MISASDFFKGDKSIADKLCDFIIRPPRQDYSVTDLGPVKFRLSDEPNAPSFLRRDLELWNMRGMKIICSWYVPLHWGMDERDRRPPPRDPKTGAEAPMALPCVVYCHANCGSRYDALEALFLLSEGFSLFTFDFCGSGKSDGAYISLGIYERQDLAAVVEFLSLEKEVRGIGLWGRSMGAVTAIMYASKDPYVDAIVCDSPFASLDLLVRDIVAARVTRFMPDFIFTKVMEGLRRNIERRAKFDINELETYKYASTCRVPALLLHGESDDFVDSKHTVMIQDWYAEGVPCLRHLIPGSHNSRRSMAHEMIASFFTVFCVEKRTTDPSNGPIECRATSTSARGGVGKPMTSTQRVAPPAAATTDVTRGVNVALSSGLRQDTPSSSDVRVLGVVVESATTASARLPRERGSRGSPCGSPPPCDAEEAEQNQSPSITASYSTRLASVAARGAAQRAAAADGPVRATVRAGPSQVFAAQNKGSVEDSLASGWSEPCVPPPPAGCGAVIQDVALSEPAMIVETSEHSRGAVERGERLHRHDGGGGARGSSGATAPHEEEAVERLLGEQAPIEFVRPRVFPSP